MAATLISEQPVVGPYVREGETQFTTLTPVTSDPANMNKIVMSTGRCLVLIQNTDAVNPEWFSAFGSDDAYGRTADITEQDTAAGGWSAYIFQPHGWEGSLGGRDLLVDTESTDVKLVAVPL